jgi:predicted Zn-dependent peptidase
MYQKTILENGIRVVSESMPSVRSVAIGMIVDAGLREEHPLKNGLAHLVEHLMFQGTASRDALQIARLMDEAGSRIGGFTTRDYTCYSATVLDDYRTYALELFGDILLNSNFLSEDVAREKEVVLREINACDDLPDQRVDSLLKAHIWAGQALGRPITGSAGTVRALTRQDVMDFFNSHYVSDRLIVAAAGNLDHQDIVSQVRDAFWCMRGRPQPAGSQALRYQAGSAVAHMMVSQVYFSIGIKTYPYTHPDRYGLHIVNKILGDGISSRLFRGIREQGLAYDIRSEYHAYRDGGLLVIEGSSNPVHFQKVFAQTVAIAWNLISGRDPLKAYELLRAKNQIKGQHIIGAEDPNTRMSRLVTQELYFGGHISAAQIVSSIDAVTIRSLEDLTLQELAQNFPEAAVAVVGPEFPQPYERLTDMAVHATIH